jgi:CRP/FNR family transcriptional regulator, cyclic AMP receptor protein
MLHSPELSRPFQAANSRWKMDTNAEKAIHHASPLNSEEPVPAKPVPENSIAALPLVTYQAGETVIADGTRTGRLFILKKGAVAIVKEDTTIAKVTEPGAVFGELSVLLDQPNKADIRTLEITQFYVADADVLQTQNPVAAHVAIALARQVDNANDLKTSRILRWLS